MGRRDRTPAFTGTAAIYAVLALSTGAALVTTVLTHVMMSVVLATFAVFCAVVGLWLRQQSPPFVRAILVRRARAGAVGGALAVAVYDATRLALVSAFHFHVRPFDALPLFGALILGVDASPTAKLAAGIAFHVANGVLFGTAYALVFASRPWWYAIGWGLCLEAAMLSLYPRLLSLEKVFAEFTIVSLTGHLAYGAVLGFAVRRGKPR